MKKFLAGLILGLILATAATAIAAPQAIRLIVNGAEVPSDPSPQMIQGRVFVPVRFVAEALGAKVEWDDVAQSVAISQTKNGIIKESNSVMPKGGDGVPQPNVQMFTVINEKLGVNAPYEDVIIHSPDSVYLSLRGIWIAIGGMVDFEPNSKKIFLYSDPAATNKISEFDGLDGFDFSQPVVSGSNRYFILLSELQSRGIITGYLVDQENKILTITTP